MRMLQDTTAILLAAGESKRFGSNNKLLEPIDGKSILHQCVITLLHSNVQRIVVVTGHNHALIKQSLEAFYSQNVYSKNLSICFNSRYQHGQSSSIHTGIEHCKESSAVLICLADMPHVQTTTINSLLRSAQDNPQSTMVAPQFNNKRGNPVLFKRSVFGDLLSINGDTGAKHYIDQHAEQLTLVQVDDAGICRDYDTPGDFSNCTTAKLPGGIREE
jgi:molybdenum cofactor cytidylyltransferase